MSLRQTSSERMGLFLDMSSGERMYIVDKKSGEVIKIMRKKEEARTVYVHLGILASRKNYIILREKVIPTGAGHEDYEPIITFMREGQSLSPDMVEKLEALAK